MANTLSKEISLKYNTNTLKYHTKNDFRQENTPDLLINIWRYNYYKPHCESCNACKIYCE